jgi:hypothetical protein
MLRDMQLITGRYFLFFQVYDASAKLPSGILNGNANQLGDFDQCLAVASQDEAHIDGKYCLASMDVKTTKLTTNDIESLQEAVQLAQAYEFIKSTYRDVSFMQNTNSTPRCCKGRRYYMLASCCTVLFNNFLG